MGHRLLSSRWVALHAVVLTVVVGCVLLGWWQLDRARDQHARSVVVAANSDAATVPLSAVLGPADRLSGDDVGRSVTAAGRYDVAGQLLVPGRVVDGEPGYAVVAPLVIDGAAVVVVRGWVPAAADGSPPPVAAPPGGDVTVTGWLSATEPPPPIDQTHPIGQVGSVHLPSLVNLLPYQLYDTVLTRTTEVPAPTEQLTPVPAPSSGGGGDWPLQNLFYAVEWWAFGLAAVAMWLSAVRRREPAPRAAATSPADAGAPLG